MSWLQLIDKLPAGLRVRRLLETIWAEITFPQSCPPGHFYSPIPSRREIERGKERIFRANFVRLPEIELRESAQLEMLARLAVHARSLKLAATPTPEKRYYSDNAYFFLADALVFAAMLMEFKPRRYLEIGSGFTSALALDVKERNPGGKLQCTFIEPSAGRLRELLRPSDRNEVVIHEARVQELPDKIFCELGENDFLFIDGSHVSKVGSDLNNVLFRVLPLLQPGVMIHFHDIYWPFEYAEQDVMRGRSWNEAYLLRAYLANNAEYQIVFFPSWLQHSFSAEWLETFPGAGGFKASSLWLRKMSKV